MGICIGQRKTWKSIQIFQQIIKNSKDKHILKTDIISGILLVLIWNHLNNSIGINIIY